MISESKQEMSAQLGVSDEPGDDVYLFPASYAQQRLWFLHQLEPGSSFYNTSTALVLKGRLNVVALEQGINEVIRRHETLRTTFKSSDGQLFQIVSPDFQMSLPLVCLRGLDKPSREEEAKVLAEEMASRTFDLEMGPVMSTSMMVIDEKEHIGLLSMSHIVSDAWSSGVLVREIAALYDAYTGGCASPLEELSVQYADYACWQQQWMKGDALQSSLDYWKRQLCDKPPMLELPQDHPRPYRSHYKGGYLSFVMPTEMGAGLRHLSREQGTTLFMTLLAAFTALLYRYTGQQDIVIGTVVANRDRSEIEPLIGLFINTLALRIDLSGNPRFIDLMSRVRKITLGAFAHKDVPFEKVVEEVQPERSVNRHPFFQAAFGLNNAPPRSLALRGLALEPFTFDLETVRFDLTLWIEDRSEGLCAFWSYSKELFREETVVRMQDNFEKLLQAVLIQPRSRLSTLEITPLGESASSMPEREQNEPQVKAIFGKRRKSVPLPGTR